MEIIDRVNEDFNKKILDMKVNVEEMVSGSLTKREMKSKSKLGAGGFSLFGDNVGKVINPRYFIFFSRL